MNDTSDLFALLYVSEMGVPDADEVGRICAQSRVNNLRDAISGLLVFDGQCFCQLVEGPGPKIVDLRRRLERDPRHRAMRVLQFGLATERRFASWRLGYAYTADPSAISRLGAIGDAEAVAAFEGWVTGLTLIDEGA